MNKEHAKKMALFAYEALEEKKGLDIRVIEIGEISPVADYFVIADGSSVPQVEAMTDAVQERLQQLGAFPARIEGAKNSGWVLMDYGDVIVHIFYDLPRYVAKVVFNNRGDIIILIRSKFKRIARFIRIYDGKVVNLLSYLLACLASGYK